MGQIINKITWHLISPLMTKLCSLATLCLHLHVYLHHSCHPACYPLHHPSLPISTHLLPPNHKHEQMQTWMVSIHVCLCLCSHLLLSLLPHPHPQPPHPSVPFRPTHTILPFYALHTHSSCTTWAQHHLHLHCPHPCWNLLPISYFAI